MIIMMLWYLYIHRKMTSFEWKSEKLAKKMNRRSKEERNKDAILVIMTVRKMYMCQHFINITTFQN